MIENSNHYQTKFEKLFKEFYSKLIFFANKYVNDLEIAEEQVSTVFAKIWENKDLYELDKLSPPFLFTMVKNSCISYLRHKKVENEYVNYLHKNKLLQEYDTFEEHNLEVKEFKEHIDRVIENLPPRCREVFKLSRFEDKKNREIAENLNISIKTVERQMTIAFNKLRFQLQHFLVFLLLTIFS
ncbi:RNA polymerase sigma-70 factor [Pedobacter alpinus]|uniref:RNA polymerase sigma-70 factor n=1 Tax=Pedobacter alpinus TaxID=1590643 RepID=A0ABW5TPX0_9SPHI